MIIRNGHKQNYKQNATEDITAATVLPPLAVTLCKSVKQLLFYRHLCTYTIKNSYCTLCVGKTVAFGKTVPTQRVIRNMNLPSYYLKQLLYPLCR